VTPVPAVTPVLEAQRTDALPAERSRLMWVGVVGILAVSTVGGWIIVASGAPEPTSPPATTQPEATPAIGPAVGTTAPGVEAPTGEPTPPEPELAPPGTATISLGSEPLGAQVLAGDVVLCVTPCLHDLPIGVEAALTFRREGYYDAIERVTPADGLVVSPRLRARRRAAGGEGGAGAAPAIKTTL
jgi:hypothetical protein